jgi:hypothetical protein
VADNGIGDYTVNLAVAMPDVNFACPSSGNVDITTANNQVVKSSPATSSTIRVLCFTALNVAIDMGYVSVNVVK